MYDIVGSLPLELVIYIAEHLNPEDMVRNQRVSKRWRVIFSARPIIKPALRKTLTFLCVDTNGSNKEVTTDTTTDVTTDATEDAMTDLVADAKSYFRWRHGLLHAKPVKKLMLCLTSGSHIQCRSRRLCYQSGPNKVEMVNLETGETSTWISSGEGKIDDLMLSDQYLVLVSEKIWNNVDLTAWNIHTGQKVSQRVHHAGSLYYTIVEDKVIIAPCSERPYSVPAYIWDLNSNIVQSIGSFCDLRLCHLNTAKNTLVAFEIYWGDHPVEVRQTKWEMTTGQLLEKRVFGLPMPADCDKMPNRFFRRKGNDPHLFFNLKCDDSSTFNQKTVTQSLLGCLHSKKKYVATILLEYNETLGQLSAQWINCAKPIDEGDYCATYLARKSIYRRGSEPKDLDSHKISTEQTLDTPFAPRRIFGDREIFGMVSGDRVQLWFFNPNFALDSTQMEDLLRQSNGLQVTNP